MVTCVDIASVTTLWLPLTQVGEEGRKERRKGRRWGRKKEGRGKREGRGEEGRMEGRKEGRGWVGMGSGEG